ncbi:hypothetical protein [Sediminibacterium soli]|uniref:hypothetical protein n=1 Tax=Sediminibacterium soli TaxID=2698829 RepID=UPI0013793D17|nr:hypothetical protein [Sediminibacterium soli]NCI45505.1 hypothetical protein [Sediminibacterium soli]
MKRGLRMMTLAAGILFATGSFANEPDTIQALKERMAKMEKQVQQLQAELKMLKSSDSSLAAELKEVKKTTPAIADKSRKLVIDRRGSKQAYLQ